MEELCKSVLSMMMANDSRKTVSALLKFFTWSGLHWQYLSAKACNTRHNNEFTKSQKNDFTRGAEHALYARVNTHTYTHSLSFPLSRTPVHSSITLDWHPTLPHTMK